MGLGPPPPPFSGRLRLSSLVLYAWRRPAYRITPHRAAAVGPQGALEVALVHHRPMIEADAEDLHCQGTAGSSQDQRPDRKPCVLSTLCVDRAVPMWGKPADGQTSAK